MSTPQPPLDLKLITTGSLVGLVPTSARGAKWLHDELISEAWQWLGEVLWVDSRFIGLVIAAAQRDNIRVNI